MAKRLGDSEWNIIFHLYSAYLYLKSENHEQALQALKECEKLLSSASSVVSLLGRRTALALYIKGCTYIETKSIDEAQKAADELKELIEKGTYRKLMRFHQHLMGLIELERKNFSAAIEYFKKALSLLPSQYYERRVLKHHEHALFIEPLALAYYKAGDLEKAQEEYEKISSLTIGRIYWGDIYAKSFYMLGKIFEQKSWKGKAIEHYAKFLDLWKDADSGMTKLDDAKARLAALQGQ